MQNGTLQFVRCLPLARFVGLPAWMRRLDT